MTSYVTKDEEELKPSQLAYSSETDKTDSEMQNIWQGISHNIIIICALLGNQCYFEIVTGNFLNKITEMKASFQVKLKNLYYVGNVIGILVSDLENFLTSLEYSLNLMENVDNSSFCLYFMKIFSPIFQNVFQMQSVMAENGFEGFNIFIYHLILKWHQMCKGVSFSFVSSRVI